MTRLGAAAQHDMSVKFLHAFALREPEMDKNIRWEGYGFMGGTDKKTKGSMKGMEKNGEKGYFMGECLNKPV